MLYDIIVIGAGPAGLTAGIYGGRAGKKVAVIGGMYMGGQAALTDKIENYSGHLSVDGFTLTYTMREQAEAFGAEFIDGEVTEVKLKGKVKSVVVDGAKKLSATSVILAMGTQTRKLGLANEDALIGQGVSYCATCDGGFFKGKTVVVNGGGDTAVTDALYLSNIASEVYLVHRRKEFRAAHALIKRLNATNVKVVLDSVVSKLKGEPLAAITVKNVNTGEEQDIASDAIFVAIGATPNTDLVKGQVKLDENGYIITNKNMKTNLAGVFAAGDVRRTPLRQVITACADGAIAAEYTCH
ncbi:MAG: FAD-dependent oxidoreductase [Clostridia bacterium]